MNGKIDEWMGGWIRMDGWKEGWMDGWVDGSGWMGG